MAEELPFEVVRQFGDFELRQYPDHVLAQVATVGDFTSVTNSGFYPLFNYISGGNSQSKQIAMTAPVLQESVSTNRHLVSFVMPQNFRLEDLPNPTNSPVTIKAVPDHLAAVIKFSGSWSQQLLNKKAELLLAAVKREGLQPIGEPYFARFDPPWKPGFLRRNEVLLMVESGLR